ncbi:MAG: TonB-dependent receptor plug domain-containing protein [Melioribacteraceae bacterium]|nr:TonB-dependent receptor plug domain-containing protein [Melioribacteraceae bacterium]
MKKYFSLLIIIIALQNPVLAYFEYQVKPDSTIIADSLLTNDSLKTEMEKQDHIPNKGFITHSDYQTIITKKEIQQMDYKNAGNLFSNSSFAFLRDLGSFGKPDELLFNGYGYNNISYLENGISINTRLNNSLYLNTIQTESIDSLEYIPLSRGFLYGTVGNPVSVNFITRDNIQKMPYTRLRILQGPDEEGYIDVIYNARIYKKFNLTFQATNSAIEEDFANSKYSSWKVSTRLRYLYSSKLNIVGSFNYFDGTTHLNGGNDITAGDIYDNFSPNIVLFRNRYQKNTRHNYNLKLQTKFIKNAPLDISFYYNYDEAIHKQNTGSSRQANVPQIFNNNKSTLWGSFIRQNLNIRNFNLDLIANYESIDTKTDLAGINSSKSYLSLSGKADITLIDSTIHPTVFAKYLKHSVNNYIGFGADGIINFTNKISLFGGVSYFERPVNILEETLAFEDGFENKQKFNNIELGGKIGFENLDIKGSFFYTRNNNELYPIIYQSADSLLSSEIGEYRSANVERSGINLDLKFSFWKIITQINSSYYFNSDNDKTNLPEYTFFGGLYFMGRLFNDNLDLKAGINFYSSGSQNYYSYDFQQSRAVAHYFDPLTLSQKNLNKTPSHISSDKAGQNYSLDLFVAGRFQELAIVYLTLENVLNRQYYIVPYYPKRSMTFRFGISWEFYN